MSLETAIMPIENDLAKRHLDSEAFSQLYHNIMHLVEETANYLDVQGRQASKLMAREVAQMYTKLSLELTSSAMRVAGIALILRAIRDEKLPLNAGLADITKKGMTAPPADFTGSLDGQPLEILELVKRWALLRSETIRMVDSLTSRERNEENPVHAAINKLNITFKTM